MKRFVFPAIVAIVLCSAWMLYLRWDTDRFIESLPKAPPHTHIEQMPQERVAENENSETLPPERVSEHNEPSAEGHVHPHFTDTLEPPDTRHTDPVSQNPDPVSGIDVEQGTEEKIETEEGDQNNRHPVMDLSLEQILEKNRRRLIEKHGPIPEIDIYLRHMIPVFEGAREGKRQVTIKRTPEEALEFSRAQSVLFPSEGNIKSYQNVLKTTQYLKRRRELMRELK